MTGKGPVHQGAIHRLLTHKEHAIEMVDSIIKETDLDPCPEHTTDELDASSLFDLCRALVHMRALQDRCIANEGVICSEELTATKAKLKEESCLREEAEKAKADLATELTTLRGQVEKAKADAVEEFKVSQPFFDAYSLYYGIRFNDYLEQVGSVYPDLDLSKINIDDIMPQTPGGDDTVSDEPDDSSHTVE
ncbi:hypothetical protein SO802_020311 [Lithocarpus litseifolius]|uniref:Uncharacterized protein n=1 Tax=Lithocarpus litseifolius TaxID=425828 RepID=A0AAW2CGV9_9ROSI